MSATEPVIGEHVGGCNVGCREDGHLLLADDPGRLEFDLAVRTTWCGAEGWHDGNEYVCHRLPNHPGRHVDAWEGWEW